ncbi:Wzz/FepE/Etk N-terminal domain-containing protein [Candidatus Thioglobus sp.]|nr:Wzz/FepE/Etk N-terminal domain-containing protein [Candidatus Thioglobus sp.]
MKNINLNNEYLDDEIDLRELLRTILNSKKLIIILTLAFSLLAFIYTTQKELEYQSTVILEVGSYRLLNGEKKLFEPVSSLIKKLKVNLIYKQQLKLDSNKLNFKSIEDQLLKINYTSLSPEFNETIINEAIRFSQESNAEILDKIVNSFSEKIVTIDNEVEFLKNSIEGQQEYQKLTAINAIKVIDDEVEFLKNSKIIEAEFLKNSITNQQESQKLTAINAIKVIDNKIPALEAKIKYLLKLIPEEENNLLLLKSDSSALLLRASSSPTLQQIIYSYNEQAVSLTNQIKDLQQEKDTLEMQIKSIAEGEFVSEELFKLIQEKDTLELQIKLVNDQTNSTKPIRELITSEIKTNTLLIILIGTILGFIFSVLIVFIRQAFLKEQN